MDALTPAERRGALVVVLLLAIGAGHDLWHTARTPAPDPAPAGERPGWAGPGEASPGTASGAAGGRPAVAPRLDLNRASARDLDALPGIGPVLAARIVAHRERHGPFRSDEELLAVRGIGPRLFARLRPLVTAGPGRPPPGPAPGESTSAPP